MKIVVIGGTGRIGSKVVATLRQGGHEVAAASPDSGVNTITGAGLKEALAGAQVVIDLANSPSFEDKAALEFFQTSGSNLLGAEAAAGVRYHVVLSIVGADRNPEIGYLCAKLAQEKLVENSGIPFTIIRSTQFMEFLGGIADSSADGKIVRISPALFQPIAADDVASIVAEVALATPRKGIVEIAGPQRAPFNEFVARYLKDVGDPREVVSDPSARYYGGRLEEFSLVPLGEARLGRIDLDEWLRRSQASKSAKISLVYEHELPNVPGKSIKGVLVEYDPGGQSPGHVHPKSAFIYATVLEGSIRSEVNNGAVTTYTAGQNFSELPGDRHLVSANASETKPAKLLAVFVLDTNEKELTIPIGAAS